MNRSALLAAVVPKWAYTDAESDAYSELAELATVWLDRNDRCCKMRKRGYTYNGPGARIIGNFFAGIAGARRD